MRKRIWTMALVVMGVLTVLSSRPAAAVDMTWTMTSTYDYKVSLAFYSQSGNRVWPGGGEVYVLTDSRAHRFTLACRPGETICYGAWPTGGATSKYWGVGRDNAQRCRTCCYVCGEANPTRELTD